MARPGRSLARRSLARPNDRTTERRARYSGTPRHAGLWWLAPGQKNARSLARSGSPWTLARPGPRAPTLARPGGQKFGRHGPAIRKICSLWPNRGRQRSPRGGRRRQGSTETPETPGRRSPDARERPDAQDHQARPETAERPANTAGHHHKNLDGHKSQAPTTEAGSAEARQPLLREGRNRKTEVGARLFHKQQKKTKKGLDLSVIPR